MEIKEGAQTTTVPDSVPVMTREQWIAEGTRRFGADFDRWKFVCPICGNIAAAADFRAFAEKGAIPDSAAQECIGRYQETAAAAFGKPKERGKPCDYALYGLFRFPGVVVTMPDGAQRMAFAFG
jgi:hypothetical protein